MAKIIRAWPRASIALVITPAEIDVLIARAKTSLDEAYKIVKDEGLWVEA